MRLIAAMAVTTIAAPVLYVLSAGPFAWLVMSGTLPGKWFDALYAPLYELRGDWQGFDRWFAWYMNHWI